MAKGWVGHPLVADYHVVSQNFRVGRHQNERTERPVKARAVGHLVPGFLEREGEGTQAGDVRRRGRKLRSLQAEAEVNDRGLPLL